MPGNALLPLSVAIADEENVMADIAKISANNTLLNLFIILSTWLIIMLPSWLLQRSFYQDKAEAKIFLDCLLIVK